VALRLELCSPAHLDQVRRFNARLRQGNVDPAFLLPENAPPQFPAEPLEAKPSVPFAKRQFLLLDQDSVRGGFLLQEQHCQIEGETHWCANIQMPVSEGLVDRKFSYVAPGMLQLLLRHRPLLFAVGMGSLEAPFAKFLSAMKWRVALVPFRFYVLQPARFLREIQPLHSTRGRSLIANLAARSGLGTSAILALQRARTRSTSDLTSAPIHQWDNQTSSLWSRYRAEVSFAAVRDAASLPFFLGIADSRFSVYRLADRAGNTRGWTVLQVTSLRQSKYFGSLRVATLLDAVCESGFECAAVQAALARARDHGADLMVTNQQHRAWLTACNRSGFWKGPSNYVLALSPELTRRISSGDPEFTRVHLSRADGDGRLNL